MNENVHVEIIESTPSEIQLPAVKDSKKLLFKIGRRLPTWKIIAVSRIKHKQWSDVENENPCKHHIPSPTRRSYPRMFRMSVCPSFWPSAPERECV